MGKNDPYHVPGQKRARLMKDYILSVRYADLEILMIGVMKSEFYIRKRIFKFLIFDQVLNS